VLAVLDPGRPTGYTTRWDYADDGTRSQPFTPLHFVDGAASVRLPDGVNPAVVKVSLLPLRPDGSGVLRIGYSYPPKPDGACLDCPADPLPWAPAAGSTGLDPISGLGPTALSNPAGAFALAVEGRMQGVPSSSLAPEGWVAAGRLPDDTEVVVGTARLDVVEPAHAYAVLVRRGTDLGADATTPAPARVLDVTRVVHGGAVDITSALPVAVRLPDGTGWVVAQHGAELSWRAGPGDAWATAGRDVVLVPAAATQVRVSRPGQAPVEVPLTR
jgi:hypothetical protein